VAGFLFDENLPAQIAEGLAVCGLDLYAIGLGAAPPRGSSDADNVAWCLANRAALVTSDRGKKNREMTDLLARHTNLSLVLVDRRMQPVELLYTFVRRHKAFEAEVERRFNHGGCYRVRLNRQGGIKRI
jgi:hypothetical protein